MVGFVYPKRRKKEYIMSDPINLQDAILKEVRRDKVPVTLFLMNGFQLFTPSGGGIGGKIVALD